MGNNQKQESPLGILMVGLFYCIAIILCMVNLLLHPSTLLFSVIALTPSVIILTIIEGVVAGGFILIWILKDTRKVFNERFNYKPFPPNHNKVSSNFNLIRRYLRLDIKPKSLFTLIFFLGIFVIGYVICDINYGESTLRSYANLSYVCVLLLILTLFFDSDYIRAHVWCIIPGFIYILWNIMLTQPANIQNEFLLINIPIFILIGYYIGTFQRTNWWMIPIACVDWILYLVILHTINPSSYSGQFPYTYGTLLAIIAISSGFALLLFIILNTIFSDQTRIGTNSNAPDISLPLKQFLQQYPKYQVKNSSYYKKLPPNASTLENPIEDETRCSRMNGILLSNAFVKHQIVQSLENLVNYSTDKKQSKNSFSKDGSGNALMILPHGSFLIRGELGELLEQCTKDEIPIYITEYQIQKIVKCQNGAELLHFLIPAHLIRIIPISWFENNVKYAVIDNGKTHVQFEEQAVANDLHLTLVKTSQDLLLTRVIQNDSLESKKNELVNREPYSVLFDKSTVKTDFTSEHPDEILQDAIVARLSEYAETNQAIIALTNKNKANVSYCLPTLFNLMFALTTNVWLSKCVKSAPTAKTRASPPKKSAPIPAQEEDPEEAKIDADEGEVESELSDLSQVQGVPDNGSIDIQVYLYLRDDINDLKAKRKNVFENMNMEALQAKNIPIIAPENEEPHLEYTLQYVTYDDHKIESIESTYNTPTLTELAGEYIGLSVLKILFQPIEFWKTGTEKTLTFSPFRVIDIDYSQKSADFSTSGEKGKENRNFPVECKGHLQKNENPPSYTKAEEQVKSSMKNPPRYEQGFITILFGDRGKTPKLRLYIEILNKPTNT